MTEDQLLTALWYSARDGDFIAQDAAETISFYQHRVKVLANRLAQAEAELIQLKGSRHDPR